MTRIRLTAALAAVLFVAGCGEPATTSAAPTTPAAPAATTPAPTLAPLDACRKAAQVVADATGLVADFAANPDGSTINTIEIKQLVREMRELQPHLPDRIGDDLGRLAFPLEEIAYAINTGENATIDTSVYRSRVPKVFADCARYASPTPTS